jgi:signal transduction histidine kinase
MGRIFFRLYFVISLALVLFLFGLESLPKLIENSVEKHENYLLTGPFSLFEKQLRETPINERSDLLEKINRGGGYPMRLKKLALITLPPEKMNRLKNGEIVFSPVRGSSYSYKLMTDTDVLEFPIGQSEYIHVQNQVRSSFNLIEIYLRKKQQGQWPSLIDTINNDFSYPVALLQSSQIKLPPELQYPLEKGEVVWQEMETCCEEYIYRRIKGSQYTVMIGPFEEPATLNYQPAILITVLAALVALSVLLWVYPLWRDLKQLGDSTKEFGQGNFSVRSSARKHSVLYHLSGSFNAMADRIQSLISSHKELTNAVSHELRTPIARLRFGMEMLQESTQEQDKNRFMASMNADIDELDQLVAELLTYARFERDRPELEFHRQEIHPWLCEVIKQVAIGKDALAIEYEVSGQELKYARFDPLLLARALGNLLQNAKRYAQTKIKVVFSQDNGCYQLSIDDDGDGILEEDREKIFDAFKRLDASRDRGTGGYGLGLSIAQRISQWHGGEITVTDSLLGGASFVIRWPENDN